MIRGGRSFGWYAPVLGVVLVVLVATAVWTVDVARARGRVQRNVTLAGIDVGGLSEDEVRTQVADLAQRFGTTVVQVNAVEPTTGATKQFTATAADVGLAVDQAATSGLLLQANRSGMSPAAWVRTFQERVDVTPVVTLIEQKAREAATVFSGSAHASAVEPKIELEDGELLAVAGSTGTALDGESVVQALQAVGYTTTPIAVPATLVQLAPTRDLAAIQAYVDQVNALTAMPLPVQAGTATFDLSPQTLRKWVVITDDGSLDMGFDETLVNQQLGEVLAPGRVAPVNASIALEGDPLAPVIRGGVDGASCCTPAAAQVVLDAVKARGPGGTGERVALPMVVDPPAVTRQAVEGLGIVEPVASFTTRHACCEARVQNIHRIADLLQGHLIPPGGMLSVNKTVGRRTLDKGFVAAPAIVEGEFGEEVGGGVSQYMTTIFNAAWFAGLDFGEYSSHSIYISRYPYGREATVNWPSPDFQVKNNLPYGVMLQNSYTDTSITVTIWSTPMFSSVEQTNQTKTEAGVACTDVRTYRTKTFLDGRSETDSTRARYRPEGVKCDGTPSATTGP